jgi:hypothetical protein
MEKLSQKSHQLPFNLLSQVCSVIQDTGFIGSAEDYVKQFYGKPFAELTVCEAEMIVRTLGNEPGCLYEGNPKDLMPAPEVDDGTQEDSKSISH